MNVPRYVRALILVFGFLSVFFLPWIFSLIAMFLAGLALPPAAFLIGLLSDVLYYPGYGVPWGTLFGFILGLISYFVRYIVKTRIM